LRLPVYVANFVLMEYGTGAISAALTYSATWISSAIRTRQRGGLPRRQDPKAFVITDTAYDGDGRMINSLLPRRDDHRPGQGRCRGGWRPKCAATCRSVSAGELRLRDWGISRQRKAARSRFIVEMRRCAGARQGSPVVLPEDVTLTSPATRWTIIRPGLASFALQCGSSKAHRETDTMDTFVDSRMVLRALHRSVERKAPTANRRRPADAGRSAISAASSTRFCISCIAASLSP
jgi:leucyl-tRNA synthetase